MDMKLKPDGPSREDVNQVVAYAASYRATRAILVCPVRDGENKGLRTVGQIDRLTIYEYTVDLSAPEPEVEEAAFADAIAGLLPPNP